MSDFIISPGATSVNSKFIKSCGIPSAIEKISPFVLVIFGGAGDLAKRKLLPSLIHLYLDGELPENFIILGVDVGEHDDDSFRELIRGAVNVYSETDVSAYTDKFVKHLCYLSINVKNDNEYKNLHQKLLDIVDNDESDMKNLIYYMAVPPLLVPVIVERLGFHNLTRGDFYSKIIVEKPFGVDKQSAHKLNLILAGAFDEDQIFRMDHYLGKETVQNIIFFRFSNSIFEPLWNYRYIENIQITVAEDIGVEHRGVFYEQAGVVRDIIQNHMMQLIGMIAMEPPSGFEADAIRDEKVKVFRSIRSLNEEEIRQWVRGQYDKGVIDSENVPAYRKEEMVASDSKMPTFIAATLYIDNWRWAGVPFYIRSGKRLKNRTTEIIIQFKQPPLRLFGRTCDAVDPNVLRIKIHPEEEILLNMGIKYPGENNKIFFADMKFNYRDAFGLESHPAYERQIIDVMKGDQTLFARQDGVEAMWDVVDPVIKYWEENPAADFPNYKSGSWGPDGSSLMLEKNGHFWHTV